MVNEERMIRMINQNSRQRVIKHAKPLIQLPRQIFSLLILLALQSCSFSSKTTKRLLQQAEKMPYDLIVVPSVPYEQGQ